MPARAHALPACLAPRETVFRDAARPAECGPPAEPEPMMLRSWLPLLPLCLLAPENVRASEAVAGSTPVELDRVRVVGVAPGDGASAPVAHRPYAVRRLDAQAIERMQAGDLTDALRRRMPGVSLNTVQGNPLQPDLQYRGFTASPLLGLPQGMAVYLDGVRLNEAFGDTVNWDLLPLAAIASADLAGGADPVFGLNTLGGALSLHSLDGFEAARTRLDIEGGSFGRRQATLQHGGNSGGFAWYLLADDWREDGWRDFSASDARRHFGNFSWRGERGRVDLSLAQARSSLNGNGPAPAQLLRDDYDAVFTAPDNTGNELHQAHLRGGFDFTDTLHGSAGVYLRQVDTSSHNGDVADSEACDDDPAHRCGENGEPVLDQRGEPVAAAFDAINNLGERRQRMRGGHAQLVFSRPLGERRNQLVIGAETLRATVRFRSRVEAATLDEDRHTTAGSGVEIADAAVDLSATTRSHAFYATDTLWLTPALSLTAALRFNSTRVVLADRSGEDPDLNGRHRFSRLNPALGFAWDISPALNAYASYGESTRAPTPVELSCADEDAPCKLPNQFIADPPLRQVVARSWEAGLRGDRGETLRWQAGLFRTRNADDILFQTTGGASSNEGFFANVADTRRQGLEASVQGGGARAQWYASYAWLDARFLDGFAETSAHHPGADAGGVLQARRGDRLPGLPRHQLKAGVDVDASATLGFGIDGEWHSGTYLRGDEANRLRRTGGYAVFGAHARWQATPRVSLRLRVDNLFDRRHAGFGALGAPDEVFAGYDDPRFLAPGAPRGAWLGVRFELL